MLRPRLLPYVSLLAAIFFSTARSADPAHHQIITVRAIQTADSGPTRLVVVDGGYAEGLEMGQIGLLPATPGASGPASLEIFDIDCHEAYCLARPGIGIDEAALDRAVVPGEWVVFLPADSSAEELRQRAIEAIGSGDYRCAVARLTRLLEIDPDNGSLQSALVRARAKLQAQAELPLDSARTAMEQAKLPLYNSVLTWYYRQDRYDCVLETAERILAVDPTNTTAASYRNIARSHTNAGETRVAAHQMTPAVSDQPPLSGPDSASIVVNPEFVYHRAARYPAEARAEGVVGRVWLKVGINETGKVVQVEIAQSSGDNRLDNAARAASWFCKFKPCAPDGRPAEGWVIYNVDFGLD